MKKAMNEKDNIGQKIQAAANGFLYLGLFCTLGIPFIIFILLSVFGIIRGNAGPSFFTVLIIMLGGSLLVGFSYYILFGFGRLIENTDKIVRNTNDIADYLYSQGDSSEHNS